jgi:hypothetical protein
MLAVALGRRAARPATASTTRPPPSLSPAPTALLEGRWQRTMRFSNGPQLLLIDELGYCRSPPRRPATSSTSSPAATSTGRSSSPPIAASAAGEIFDDTTVASAILDRRSSTMAPSSRSTAPPIGCVATNSGSKRCEPASKPLQPTSNRSRRPPAGPQNGVQHVESEPPAPETAQKGHGRRSLLSSPRTGNPTTAPSAVAPRVGNSVSSTGELRRALKLH